MLPSRTGFGGCRSFSYTSIGVGSKKVSTRARNEYHPIIEDCGTLII